MENPIHACARGLNWYRVEYYDLKLCRDMMQRRFSRILKGWFLSFGPWRRHFEGASVRLSLLVCAKFHLSICLFFVYRSCLSPSHSLSSSFLRICPSFVRLLCLFLLFWRSGSMRCMEWKPKRLKRALNYLTCAARLQGQFVPILQYECY